MKKFMYLLIALLVVVGGLVFANRVIRVETSKKAIHKPMSEEERSAAIRHWEATPEGLFYKQWERSDAGKKVFAAEAKIRNSLNTFSDMEATVSSLTLPPGSRLGYGIMVKIKGEEYILAFGPESQNKKAPNFKSEFAPLRALKLNDKIIIRSKNVSHAPKYTYPIVAGDYVEKDRKVLYKRVRSNGGC